MGLDTRYQLPVLDDCHGMLTIPCHQVGMIKSQTLVFQVASKSCF